MFYLMRWYILMFCVFSPYIEGAYFSPIAFFFAWNKQFLVCALCLFPFFLSCFCVFIHRRNIQHMICWQHWCWSSLVFQKQGPLESSVMTSFQTACTSWCMHSLCIGKLLEETNEPWECYATVGCKSSTRAYAHRPSVRQFFFLRWSVLSFSHGVILFLTISLHYEILKGATLQITLASLLIEILPVLRVTAINWKQTNKKGIAVVA